MYVCLCVCVCVCVFAEAARRLVPSRNSLHYAVLGGHPPSIASVMRRLPGLALEQVCAGIDCRYVLGCLCVGMLWLL
ncbi:MAG: hypothetical protein P4L40_18285 [Terracidiphilus sp.]|nr:hypothetical protein [Terracidiphilus sp.]